MSDPYVRSLIPKIRAILKSSDLSTISAKSVRKELVSRGEDEGTIKASRSKIDDEISTIYDSLTAGGGGDGAASPPSSLDLPIRAKAEPAPEPGSSQPRPLTPSSRVKTEAEVKPTRARETDEEMARRLQTQYEAEGGSRPRRAAQPAKKKSKKRVSRAEVDEESGERKKKRPAPDNNFNKELILSDSLSALVDAPRLSRPQVVKHIWDYVKSRSLQDQSDRRYILCDDKLYAVFHTERLHMFTMNKLLVPHLRNPDDVIIKDEVKGEAAPVPPVVARAVNTAREDQALASPAAEESEEESDDEDY